MAFRETVFCPSEAPSAVPKPSRVVEVCTPSGAALVRVRACSLPGPLASVIDDQAQLLRRMVAERRGAQGGAGEWRGGGGAGWWRRGGGGGRVQVGWGWGGVRKGLSPFLPGSCMHTCVWRGMCEPVLVLSVWCEYECVC